MPADQPQRPGPPWRFTPSDPRHRCHDGCSSHAPGSMAMAKCRPVWSGPKSPDQRQRHVASGCGVDADYPARRRSAPLPVKYPAFPHPQGADPQDARRRRPYDLPVQPRALRPLIAASAQSPPSALPPALGTAPHPRCSGAGRGLQQGSGARLNLASSRVAINQDQASLPVIP